jgi:hypothetical protein
MEIGDFLTNQTIVVGQTFLLPLSNFTESYGNNGKIFVFLGSASAFLTYDQVSMTLSLSVSPLMMLRFVGSYQVKMVVTDGSGSQATYLINIEVVK